MTVIVNTNTASLNANRNLEASQSMLDVSMRRLSSGLRINSAKDDAAGLAVASSLTAQILGNSQAIRNANDGISLGQTAEGALGQIAGNLQRIREIAVQAANGTLKDSNRQQLQKEVDQLTQEISRTIKTASFNGTLLLSGTTTLKFQVGANGAQNNQINVTTVDLSIPQGAMRFYSYNQSLSATGVIDVSTQQNAVSSIPKIDSDIDKVATARSIFGAVQNRFETVITNLQNYVENMNSSRSRIIDADFASESAALTRNKILQESGIAVSAQANLLPKIALSLLDNKNIGS